MSRLFTPRNFGSVGRLARAGDWITPRRRRWDVFPVPAGYTRALYNQRSNTATIRYGFIGLYATGVDPPTGGFTPNMVAGMPVVRFVVQETGTNNVVIRCGDGNQQLPGVATLSLTIEGFGALSLPWVGGSQRYQVTSASFWTFMSDPARLNKIIGVNGMPA